ncbi:methylthioribulose 1-phosphate dehydratase [Paludibacterium yongneupense]|uniref:methylthioribulose 1-phosphate dehydratase n=1 Tax=Paludibacterium yongneupense TaxID=400061 RepID=UPI00041DA4E4|nr:methylthioribulose 1-phosphate dehydratase [Paludibacterium yongneupense]
MTVQSDSGPEVEQLIAAAGDAARRGWIPATSGNFSVRIGERIAITRSGCDKSALRVQDMAQLALDDALPAGVSAEAPLHLARYRADAAIGAILHVHAGSAALVSRLSVARGHLLLHGWELLKAFSGIGSHDVTLRVPVFANAQDTAALARQIETELASAHATRLAPGYLLAGHGLYAWGRDVAEARRHLEAFDALLTLQWQFDHQTLNSVSGDYVA